VTTAAVTAAAVADRMAALLAARPLTFYELLRELPDVEYRTILQAWGTLRERRALARDAHGRYLLREG
jgi:hypothetical protein